MNVQLVNSLVEVVLNLSPEDQKFFQEKLSSRQKGVTSSEKVEQFRKWVAQFPKSNVNLSDETLCRENIYDD